MGKSLSQGLEDVLIYNHPPAQSFGRRAGCDIIGSRTQPTTYDDSVGVFLSPQEGIFNVVFMVADRCDKGHLKPSFRERTGHVLCIGIQHLPRNQFIPHGDDLNFHNPAPFRIFNLFPLSFKVSQCPWIFHRIFLPGSADPSIQQGEKVGVPSINCLQ